MKKFDVLDEELNPDGIAKPLQGLAPDVWDRGYCANTDDDVFGMRCICLIDCDPYSPKS